MKNSNFDIRYRIIHKILKEHEKVSAGFIAELCREQTGDEAIDPGLIQKDLDEMANNPQLGLHAPVVFDETLDEYYYADPEYSIEKHSLSREESESLSIAISILNRYKYHNLFGGFRGLVQKLQDIFSPGSPGEQQNFDFIDFEEVPSFRGSSFLPKLIDHIRKKEVIRIYYQPFYEDKPYFITVHPYLLKEYRYRWYLVGLNDRKHELRTYALDRIWDISPANEKYIYQKFKNKDYFAHTVGVISPTGPPPEIELSVTRHQAQYLITQPLHSSQVIVNEDEERTFFRYKVHPTYEFKQLIMAMGAEAVVLKPESFRDEIKKELIKTIHEYDPELYPEKKD